MFREWRWHVRRSREDSTKLFHLDLRDGLILVSLRWQDFHAFAHLFLVCGTVTCSKKPSEILERNSLDELLLELRHGQVHDHCSLVMLKCVDLHANIVEFEVP